MLKLAKAFEVQLASRRDRKSLWALLLWVPTFHGLVVGLLQQWLLTSWLHVAVSYRYPAGLVILQALTVDQPDVHCQHQQLYQWVNRLVHSSTSTMASITTRQSCNAQRS